MPSCEGAAGRGAGVTVGAGVAACPVAGLGVIRMGEEIASKPGGGVGCGRCGVEGVSGAPAAGLGVGAGVPALGVGAVPGVPARKSPVGRGANEIGADGAWLIEGGCGVGADVIAPREGSPLGADGFCWAPGVTWRPAAVAGADLCDSGLDGPMLKIKPWLLGSNGLLISAGTSMCFCTRRRAIRAGLRRERISLKGRGTATRSRSTSAEKMSGASWRSSPKVILTAPRESCERTFSRGIEMLRSPTLRSTTRG
jgi:hypothetical protein